MARTVNTALRAVRYDAFVDAAQVLIQTKGYEQMSVQDVLDQLDASRGAFYHYFDSKVALLEAVVERMVESAMTTLAPVVADSSLPALAKLERFFTDIASFKAARKELVLGLMEVWLSDDNAIVREKFRKGLVVSVAPLFAAIVKQGVAEGTFKASSPADTARVLVSLVQGANELATELFVAHQSNPIPIEVVERTLATYTEAYERILGVPAGSLNIGGTATLREWFN